MRSHRITMVNAVMTEMTQILLFFKLLLLFFKLLFFIFIFIFNFLLLYACIASSTCERNCSLEKGPSLFLS